MGDLKPTFIRKLETEEPVPPNRTKPKSTNAPAIKKINTMRPVLLIVIFISLMLPPIEKPPLFMCVNNEGPSTTKRE